MAGRLEDNRKFLVPWLMSARRSLAGLCILELGCGTGASTVALAEQGALVTAVDIDGAVRVAAERCAAYRVTARFTQANAVSLGKVAPDPHFDIVACIAVLEHMTNDERIDTLRAAWSKLKHDGLLLIAQTPNRLWPFDHHTSLLPFFHWLPDELAVLYSASSPRESYSSQFDRVASPDMTLFARRGRGVSFHELDIALGSSWRSSVLSSLAQWHRRRSSPACSRWRMSKTAAISTLLGTVGPEEVHAGFYEPVVNVVLDKSMTV